MGYPTDAEFEEARSAPFRPPEKKEGFYITDEQVYHLKCVQETIHSSCRSSRSDGRNRGRREEIPDCFQAGIAGRHSCEQIRRCC